MDFISHCIKRNQWKLQGRATSGMLIILVVLSLLGWIYLTQASYVATTSRRVQTLEQDYERLQQENLQLFAEVAELESVSRLAQRANELGFVALTQDNTQFLLVEEVPSVPENEQGDASFVSRWVDGFASQFTAWVQAGGR